MRSLPDVRRAGGRGLGRAGAGSGNPQRLPAPAPGRPNPQAALRTAHRPPAARSVPRVMPAVAPVAGRYLLADQIGAGGMGTVWRAWDRAERRWVAAKVLGRHDAAARSNGSSASSAAGAAPPRRRTHRLAADDDRMLFTMDLVRGGDARAAARAARSAARRATCGWSSTRSSRPWWPCTPRGWCTATSSRATCCSSPPARAGRGSGSATSGSPSLGDPRLTRVPGGGRHRRLHAARAGRRRRRPTRDRTCTPRAWSRPSC